MTTVQQNLLGSAIGIWFTVAVGLYGYWVASSEEVDRNLKAPTALIWIVFAMCLLWPLWLHAYLVTWPGRALAAKFRKYRALRKAERLAQIAAQTEQDIQTLKTLQRMHLQAGQVGPVGFAGLEHLRRMHPNALLAEVAHDLKTFHPSEADIATITAITAITAPKTAYKPPKQPHTGSKHSYAALEALFTAVEAVTYPDALLHGPITDGPEMTEVNQALRRLYAERAEMEKPDGDV